MYSFSTSFCTVPESFATSAPCRFATATYNASRIDAVALIVIEVEILVRSMPSNSRCMSSMESIATPTLPTSPAASGWSESKPIWVGRSNATDKSGGPVGEQILVALVGLLGVAHAGVLPHGPQPAAIHRGLDSAREWILPGVADLALLIPALEIRRGVQECEQECGRRSPDRGTLAFVGRCS